MNIQTALERLNTLQMTVSITDPSAMSTKKAYPTIPSGKGMPEPPCFLNFAKPVRIEHIAGARRMRWIVRSQLLVHDADQDVASDIALAFASAYIDVMSNAQTLDGGIGVILDGMSGSDIPIRLEYAGRFFIGAEFTIELAVPLEAVTVGP